MQVDHRAPLLRQITPARLRQLDDPADDAVELDFGQRPWALLRPIELAHAAHGARHIVDRRLYRREVCACALAERGLPLEKRLRVERDRRNGVVDVVRDAARHLSQRAQSLLLYHRLLAVTQILVGPLQRVVELRLVGRESDVLAQLPQELAIAAG